MTSPQVWPFAFSCQIVSHFRETAFANPLQIEVSDKSLVSPFQIGPEVEILLEIAIVNILLFITMGDWLETLRKGRGWLLMVVRLVAVPCQLYPGVFDSERVFEVILHNGERHQGVAPRYFCWNERKQLVAEGEETNGVAGMIAAKLLDASTADYAVVEVPDAEVLAVDQRVIAERPTRIEPPNLTRERHVPVGS